MKVSELKTHTAKSALQTALKSTYLTGQDAGEREVPDFLEVASHHRHGHRANMRHLRAHHRLRSRHRHGHHAMHQRHTHGGHRRHVHHGHTALLMEHQMPADAPNATNTSDVP